MAERDGEGSESDGENESERKELRGFKKKQKQKNVRRLLSGFLIFFLRFIPQPSAPQLAASHLGRRALQYYNEVICIHLRHVCP